MMEGLLEDQVLVEELEENQDRLEVVVVDQVVDG